jgi:hypothetical protein
MVRSIGREDVAQQKIEEAAALLEGVIDGLRRRPSEQMAAAAHEALVDLRPHVEAALEALEDIEGRRHLTDREHDLQRAFKMLLAVRGQPGG